MKDTLFSLVSVPVLFIAVLISLVWVGLDAAKRGRNAAWVVLLCFVTWPLGLVIWRSVRPPPPV